MEIVELKEVCWLEVHGKFQTWKLSPGVNYEVAFVVMLKEKARGWEVPVYLRLSLPNGKIQEHKEYLMKKIEGQWMEIPVGKFYNEAGGGGGEIEFSLYEYEGGQWKRGLVIKGAIIRPSS